MSPLTDQLQADLTAAMKARDELRSATLRMVLTAVRTEEVADGGSLGERVHERQAITPTIVSVRAKTQEIERKSSIIVFSCA